MRDLETSNLAVSAALTGHLVFSTLHTNDAVSSIARMIEIGVDPYLVSATLDSIIAQRLIRTLCPQCKEALPRSHPDYSLVKSGNAATDLFRPVGCSECKQTGFNGRTVIYEFLRISSEIREMINAKASLVEIRRQALLEGLREMNDVAMEKVRLGLTTYEEVRKVSRLEK